MTIRRARPDDALAVASVHVRSWKVAYPGLIPQSFLDGLTPEARLPIWEKHLSNRDSTGLETLVLVEQPDSGVERIAGFTSFGPTTHEDFETVGEVMTLYLDPDWWGQGRGAQLLKAAVENLRVQRLPVATLWVLETNVRARRFYEHLGWHPDGATKLHDWKAFVATDVRYRLDLDEAGSYRTQAPRKDRS